MKACIKAVASYLPKEKLTNEMLAEKFPEWSIEKISKKIGIEERSIAKEETVSDMAVAAARELFVKFPLNPSHIDFVLLCTQSPDYFLPTTACLIQHTLGIPSTAGAIDFNQGCSGYVYGLSLAKGLIAAGIAKNILLLTSETYSKYIHPTDKSNQAIFGDAATASWIGVGDGLEIGEFVLGTDGSGANNLIVKNGGGRYPQKSGNIYKDDLGLLRSDDHLYMNGSEIFNFTLESIPELVHKVIEKNNLEMSEIDWYIFHQANAYMLKHLQTKIKIPQDRFPIYLEKTGNTVSSTIPLVLEKLNESNKIGRLQNILLAGFGVGYSWGAVTLKNRV